MSMVVINCLHLTDLHLGMDASRDLWPNVEEAFLQDLAFLVREAGPLDLVLFSGDLTHSGSPGEFERVSALLTKLWKRFSAQRDSKPLFVALPGNHDLTRPADPTNPALVTLMEVWNKPAVQKPFWDNPDSAQRQLVSQAFANYSAWWHNVSVPKPEVYSDGLLPGDFAATVEKDGFKLGILGLNSTFLQLTGGDLKGKLALDVRQFNQACGGNGPDWVGRHHVCLLLTHHPLDWLTPEAQEDLNGEIHYPPERFVLHLFGHMHEPNLRSMAEGGGDARRRLQGCSLFGVEGWGAANTARLHGYSLCQLKIDDNTAELRIWPRKAEKKQGGGWRIDRDSSFALPKGEDATKPIGITLLNSWLRPGIETHDIALPNGGQGGYQRTIEFAIEQGKIEAFDADVIALKYAQSFYGADKIVMTALRSKGLTLEQMQPAPEDFRYVDTRGSIRARHSLFVGVQNLREIDYRKIRDFSTNVLKILAVQAPSTRDLAMTIHGPGFGLDERAAVLAQFDGLWSAVRAGQLPLALRSISIVEVDQKRVERLRVILEQYLTKAEYASRIEGRWAYQLVVPLQDVQHIKSSKGIATTEHVVKQSAVAPRACVAMPFGEETEDVFYFGIQGPVHSAGLLCERIIQDSFTGDIFERIKEKVEIAKVLIADLSSSNPYVYLAVGYAWGKGRPTILVVKYSQEGASDVRGQRCLTYRRIKELDEALTKELGALRTSGLI